jgi:hypothetical protein
MKLLGITTNSRHELNLTSGAPLKTASGQSSTTPRAPGKNQEKNLIFL